MNTERTGSVLGAPSLLKSQEHYDLMTQFEMELSRAAEFYNVRFTREAKEFWPLQRIYTDGRTNELFLAYRRGYALARSVSSSDSERSR